MTGATDYVGLETRRYTQEQEMEYSKAPTQEQPGRRWALVFPTTGLYRLYLCLQTTRLTIHYSLEWTGAYSDLPIMGPPGCPLTPALQTDQCRPLHPPPTLLMTALCS